MTQKEEKQETGSDEETGRDEETCSDEETGSSKCCRLLCSKYPQKELTKRETGRDKKTGKDEEKNRMKVTLNYTQEQVFFWKQGLKCGYSLGYLIFYSEQDPGNKIGLDTSSKETRYFYEDVGYDFGNRPLFCCERIVYACSSVRREEYEDKAHRTEMSHRQELMMGEEVESPRGTIMFTFQRDDTKLEAAE